MYRLLPYMDSPYPVYCTEIQKIHLMPELPEGVKIGDVCEFWDSDMQNETMGELTDVTQKGRFVMNDNVVWDHCRPIKKEMRVKSAIEIMLWLVGNGWTVDEEGDWYKDCGYIWYGSMFQFCSKKPPREYKFIPEWLEEKE